MTAQKLQAGIDFPIITLPNSDGGEIALGGAHHRWTLLVIYRGKHCPRCKKYLNQLETMLPDWDKAGFDIVVISADSQEKALADKAEFGWSFTLGHSLSMDQMRALGLYISTPLSDAETDSPFAEPALFGINPEGKAQIISINNAPAVRPDLVELLDGMIFTVEHKRPIRGTA